MVVWLYCMVCKEPVCRNLDVLRVHREQVKIQGDQLNIAVFFLYRVPG